MPDSPITLGIDSPAWLAFVDSRSEATPFHHPTWAALIAKSYCFESFVFALSDVDRGIVAGIPMLKVGRGRRWIALAFTDHCAPLGSVDACAELLRHIEQARLAEGVSSVEIRAASGGLARENVVGYSHILKLELTAGELFESFHPSQVKRAIRKAERSGVSVRAGRSRADLETFYAMHLSTRRRLGVPIQPRRFFDGLWEHMIEPGLGVIFVAELGGAPVAAAVFLGYQRTLVYKFGASDQDAWSHRPNHALFWEAIRWGQVQGFASLDFGRTELDNGGLRSFKSHWGTAESELVYSELGATRTVKLSSLAVRTLGLVIRNSPEMVCREIGEHLYRFVP